MFLFLFSCILSGEPTDAKPKTFEWYEVGYSKAETAMRSSIKISIYENDVEIGHGSGNYFSYAGERFVLTAAHVVHIEQEQYVLDGSDKVSARVIYIDFENDIAILKPSKKLKTKPVRWRRSNSKKIIGKETFYAGWPSGYGKNLISGMVSSVLDKDAILIHSFALPGSSGSVVFDKSGRVLGVVSAVGVHQSPFSPYPTLQEDMVYVSTVSSLTNLRLMEVLKCGR
jgi:S1-C subfamily serine protease